MATEGIEAAHHNELGAKVSFEQTPFGTQMSAVRDPDGRVWGLQAPLAREPRETRGGP